VTMYDDGPPYLTVDMREMLDQEVFRTELQRGPLTHMQDDDSKDARKYTRRLRCFN
jgi:hypothetical protein